MVKIFLILEQNVIIRLFLLTVELALVIPPSPPYFVVIVLRLTGLKKNFLTLNLKTKFLGINP